MKPVIARSRHLEAVLEGLRAFPSVGLLGPRQVGKTTLAWQIAARWPGPTTHFDLEDPDHLRRLDEPRLTLESLEGLVVIDEIQRRPELFPFLHALADRPEIPARFLILGSASPELLRQGSESLAGRILFHELDGFTTDEVGMEGHQDLWLRGGLPPSFLAPTDADSATWRRAFIDTFIERDLPQLGVRIPPRTTRRFWRMVAHQHAQVWHGAELARGLGVAQSTVKRYLDSLQGALVLRELLPWHENLKKRQVRSSKIYVRDTGLLHMLLGIETRDDLAGHPRVGASWEGFVICEVIRRIGARSDECFFWATHAGAELDLLVVRGTERRGYEIKLTTGPRTTRSMHIAREDLKLTSLTVIHAGAESFPLARGIEAVAFGRIHEDLLPL